MGETKKGPPKAVQELEKQLATLPGVGKVTARRLAYHLLGVAEKEALSLAQAIIKARKEVVRCQVCWNLSAHDPCWICSDMERDRKSLCVVEDARDLLALEKAGVFKGLYHVLPSRLSPLQGLGPESLAGERLKSRVVEEGITEVVFATNPDQEGEATARFLAGLLAPLGVTISRIARGIPAGSSIEQVQASILQDAFEGRRVF